jgi:hypothetical protein
MMIKDIMKATLVMATANPEEALVNDVPDLTTFLSN